MRAGRPLNGPPRRRNATIKLELTDKGRAGRKRRGDDHAVWDKDNNVFFSGKWDGTSSVRKLPGGGNLVTH